MTPKTFPDQVADATDRMKDAVNQAGRSATDKMEKTRTAAADSLDATASALHGGGEKVADFAHTSADKLSSTASYLRKNDVNSIMGDVQSIVRRNPGAALLVAGLVGFSLAHVLRPTAD